jgi:hypothetical protein
MPNLATDLDALVQQLKTVVVNLNERDTLTVKVTAFTMTLKLQLLDNHGAEGKAQFALVSYNQTDALVQTLTLRFSEQAITQEVAKFHAETLEEPLIRASEAISIAVRDATANIPAFAFQQGKVNVAFSATSDGKLEFSGLKAGLRSENVSGIELELAPKS